MATQTFTRWLEVSLGDIAKIESGGTPGSSKSEYWDNGEICWATLPDLKSKYLSDTKRKITSLGLKNSSAKILPINSVIFSSRATIGEISIAKVQTSTNQGSKNFICDPTKIEYEFLYYLLKSKVEEISSLASGATYKEINKTVFSGVKVKIPDLSTQKRIADVLSAYDDLIENNNRRIKILEETAQKIYTEWFVNLRFPGYEKVKFEKDGLPDGWETKKLEEVININPTYSSKDQFTFKKIAMDRLSNNSMILDTENVEEFSKISGTRFKNHDVLFARITPCLENGKTGYVHFLGTDEIAFGSTEFIVMRGEKVPSSFVYCLSRNKDFRLSAQKTMTGASGRQRVANDFFKKYEVILPTKQILNLFQEITDTSFLQIETLRRSNEFLRKTRNLLIPQLVTGKLELK